MAGDTLTWYATMVQTCAASYLSQTVISAGSAPSQAALQYTGLRNMRRCLQPTCLFLCPLKQSAL